MARGPRRKSGPGRPPTDQDTEDDSDIKNDRIKVVVRVRPLNPAEQAGSSTSVVRVVGEQMLVFDPKEEATPEYFHGKARRQRDINKRAARDVKFMFDHVFDSDSHTMQLFENTTMKILDGIMDGYNCSVFAYGATGAGKTHTMLGSPESPGVIFLTMMELYRRMEEVKDTKTCDIAVSYLEVYNEQIRDLLMPGAYLPVREDPNRGVTIAGLSLHKPYSADELMHMLRIGNSNRTQHPTDANSESSRSHAVFQVFVRQRDRTANTSADWRVAKMSLIDLAGSERATVTKNRGARFREGANINRSLLALGNCINALADGKSKGYVPYRNSKLTRLLKDSLGGNCRTVMIAAVSPSSMSFEDTYNTLRYADRAKSIKVGLKRNVLSVDLHVSRYVQVIEELRKEVNELKIKLRTTESGALAASEYSPDLTTKATYERLFTSLDSVFKARVEIRKEMLELESSCRDLQYKAYRKQLMLTRIALIVPGEKEVTECLRRGIKGAERRRQNIEKRRQAQESRMAENVTWLNQVEEEIQRSRANNAMAEALDQNLRVRHLEVELRDQRRQAKYLKKLCRAQEREAHSMEKFNTQLLRTVYHQYMVIKGHNLASYKEIEQFELIQHMACQNVDRSVAWADQSFGGGEDHGVNVPTTPGPSQNCSDLDLATLLDFPILMGAPISPSKTPHHKSCHPAKVQTPNNKNMSGTPSSARRRRRTPRRTPKSAQRGHSNIPTPAKTVMSHIDSTETVACPAQKLFPAAHSDAHSPPLGANRIKNASFTSEDGVFPLQPSPVGNPAVARGGDPSQPSPKDPPQPSQGGTAPCAVRPQQQQTGPLSAPMMSQPVINHPQHQEPCHVPLPVPSSPPSVEPRPGELEESVQRFMDSTIILGPAVALPSQQTDSHPTLNSTVVIDSAVIKVVNSRGLPLPVASSPPQMQEQELVNSLEQATPQRRLGASVTPDSVINSGTVTKCRPTLLGETVTKVSSGARTNTVTKLVHGSATITKSKPNDENAIPPNDSVVRAMDFGLPNCRDPSGLLSFADVVRSPAPPKVKKLQFEEPPRSPLASRDNLPSNLTRSNLGSASTGKMFVQGKEASRMLSQPLRDNPNVRRHTVHNRRVAEATETLRKFGIPSMLDKSAVPKVKTGPGTPGYMKSTKASSRHNRSHRRSITAEDGYRPTGQARRNLIAQNENMPPGPGPRRTLIKSRSKSTVSLGARKGFL